MRADLVAAVPERAHCATPPDPQQQRSAGSADRELRHRRTVSRVCSSRDNWSPVAYRIRVAARIDTAGRAGSVEMPFRAGVRSIGGLQLSDVLPGARDESPAIYVPAGMLLIRASKLSSQEVERFATRRCSSKCNRPVTALQ